MLAAPGLLAACGGSGPGAATVSSAVRTAAEGPGPGARVPDARGVLDFFGYEGDDALEFTKAWRSAHEIDLKATYISSDAEIEARFLGGGGQGSDLLSMVASASPYLIEQNLLAPIDPDKVPRLAHLWPFFAEEDAGQLLNRDGQWVGIPLYWGTIGLAWDRSVVKDVTAWEDVLDPAFRGQVAMLDNPQLSLYAACAVLGLEPSRLTAADLDRVRDWLRPVFGQVKTLSASVGDLISLLGSREVAAVFPGFAFIANAAVAHGNTDATYDIRLEEGYPVLTEALALSPKADNPDAALAYINELLTPPVQRDVAVMQGAAVTVDDAARLLPPEIGRLYPYDDLAAFYAQARRFTDPPRRSSEYATARDVTDMWAELKRGAQG